MMIWCRKNEHTTYFQNPDIFQTSYKALMYHNSEFEVCKPLIDKSKELLQKTEIYMTWISIELYNQFKQTPATTIARKKPWMLYTAC